MKNTLKKKIAYLTEHPELMPVVLGPTACGKTRLAVLLAQQLNGAILSADSRQVYTGMDIGSGKDLEDYLCNGKEIPYRLIDIVPAGSQYNVFLYQEAFDKAYTEVKEQGLRPILCGGSGLYLQSALGSKKFVLVGENKDLREKLSAESESQLEVVLKGYGSTHNKTDLESRERCLRAIEIAEFEKTHSAEISRVKPKAYIIGISVEPELLRERIGKRLTERLDAGLIEEVEGLLQSGIKPEQLTYYGLEYKYITEYISGNIESKEKMKNLLFFAICQFAKRQRTWFRGMEKKGWNIDWINANEIEKS